MELNQTKLILTFLNSLATPSFSPNFISDNSDTKNPHKQVKIQIFNFMSHNSVILP